MEEGPYSPWGAPYLLAELISKVPDFPPATRIALRLAEIEGYVNVSMGYLQKRGLAANEMVPSNLYTSVQDGIAGEFLAEMLPAARLETLVAYARAEHEGFKKMDVGDFSPYVDILVQEGDKVRVEILASVPSRIRGGEIVVIPQMAARVYLKPETPPLAFAVK